MWARGDTGPGLGLLESTGPKAQEAFPTVPLEFSPLSVCFLSLCLLSFCYLQKHLLSSGGSLNQQFLKINFFFFNYIIHVCGNIQKL